MEASKNAMLCATFCLLLCAYRVPFVWILVRGIVLSGLVLAASSLLICREYRRLICVFQRIDRWEDEKDDQRPQNGVVFPYPS